MRKEETMVKCAVVLLIAAGAALIHMYIPDFYHTVWTLLWQGNLEGLAAYMASFGYGAAVISVGLIAVCNITGLPSIPFLTVNGILFGLVPGLIISWLGEVIGIVCGFLVMRTIFRGKARKLIEKSGMTGAVNAYSTLKAMTIVRSIPYSPNVVVTALAAVSPIRFRDHLVATLIGKVPSVGIEVWLGHDLLQFGRHGGRFMLLAAMALAVCIGYRQYQKRRRS